MLLLCCVIICNATFGAVSVQVFSYEEACNQTNMSKPRIYISNNGSEPITNCSYRYYFYTENGKTPVLDDYYTPDENVTVENIEGDLYRLVYTVNKTILPGDNVPFPPGNSIGLHYNDWSLWDKTNDYSNNHSAISIINDKIAVYSNGICIYGSEPVNRDSTTVGLSDSDLRLLSFALYSSEKSIVKDRTVFSGGGAVGSNGYVEIKESAVISGNVVSGGVAQLKAGAHIYGDVIVADTVDIHPQAVVNGKIEEKTSVAILQIPQKDITPGDSDITVYQGQTLSLAPGIYKDLLVMTGGTLQLSPGNYVFSDFLLQTDVEVIFNVTPVEFIEIDIQRNMDISDRAKLRFSGFSYSPAVRMYTNDPDTLRIGCDAVISGILSAPNAVVNIFSRAQCDGAIYSKEIIIEPDVGVSSSLVNPDGDDDGDGISNYTEIFVTKTDPLDSNSYKKILIPFPSKITSKDTVTVCYDTKFYSDYKHGKITVTYNDSSLVNPDISPVLYITNTPAIPQDSSSSVHIPNLSGYDITGRYLVMPESTMCSTGTARVGFLITKDEIMSKNNFIIAVADQNGNWSYHDPVIIKNELGEETEDEPYRIYVDVENFSALVLMRKNVSATAYLDRGMIFSNRQSGARIKAEIMMADCPYGVRSGHLRIHYRNSDNTEDMVEMQLEAKAIVVFWLFNSKVFSFPNPVTVTRIELKVDNTPIDYSYDVNYAVSGECLTLTAKKYFNEYLTPDDHISATSSIAYDLESVDIDGEGRIYQNGTNYQYDYYLKDHLGSTRMVINDQNQITEAIAYQPYGTIVPMEDIATSPQTSTRQQFTGKEFDREGSGVGISGMELYYFGKRYYDPELGVWVSTDPKDQFFNPYGYSTNPINTIDPDGQYVVGAIIGAAVGAYLGGAMSNGSLNPGKWDWSDPGTFMGMFSGALSGASMGSGIENSIIKQAHLNNIGNGGLKTTYAQNAYVHSLRTGPVYTDWKNAYADAYILNRPYSVYGAGHEGILLGNEEMGYTYFSKDGLTLSEQTMLHYNSYEEFVNSIDPHNGMQFKESYLFRHKISTTMSQDQNMLLYGLDNFQRSYNLGRNNCADLVGEILNAGGLKGFHEGFLTFPNSQFKLLKATYPAPVLDF